MSSDKCGKLLCVLLICCSILTGCGKESSSSALAEQFLKQVFTSNLEQRYDSFQNVDIADENALKEATHLYYQDFEAMVTEDCLEKLVANRIPLSYDKAAAESNAEVSVEKISLEALPEGGYEYTVTLKVMTNGESEEASYTGQLQFEMIDGEERVSAFSCQ